MNLHQQSRSSSSWKCTCNSSHFTNPTLSIRINQISFSWYHPNHINSWINTLKTVINTSFVWHSVGRNKVDDIWFKVGLRWLLDQNRLNKYIVEVPKIGQNTSPPHCKSFSMLSTHLEDFNCYIIILHPLLVLECQWVWFLCTSISIIGLRHILATLDELLFVATISSGASLMLSSNLQSWSSSLQPLL